MNNTFQSPNLLISVEPQIAPWGELFNQTFVSLYKIGTRDKSPLKIHIHEVAGLPNVSCKDDFNFVGLVNENEAEISKKYASELLTDFLLGHLVHIFSNEPTFTNKALLEGMKKKRGELKAFLDSFNGTSDEMPIYKFLD